MLLISISQAPIPNHRLLKNARLAPGSPGQEPQGPWQEDVLPPVLGGIMPGHRSMAKSWPWPWPMFDHFYPLDLIGLSWTMDFHGFSVFVSRFVSFRETRWASIMEAKAGTFSHLRLEEISSAYRLHQGRRWRVSDAWCHVNRRHAAT